jgi:NAD+ synthase
MQIDVEAISLRIEGFIREQVDYFQRTGVVLGMSGGIDSAVVGTLAARALGADKVLALLLPERDSSPDSKGDALLEIERLGIACREITISPILEALGIYHLLPIHDLGGSNKIIAELVRLEYKRQAKSLGETPFSAGLLGTRNFSRNQKRIDIGNAYARAKHRARMITLYFIADQENRLVLGTTNKSENMSGFVVKYGDNAADIEPILPLYKTQVRQLAAYLEVSQKIIDKPPTPDLMPGVVDELALGIDYATLDQILEALELGHSVQSIVHEQVASAEAVAHVQEMAQRSQHLRSLPPVPKLDI